MKPVVSIIIATYNSGKLLPLVFAGLKKQTFRRSKIEIIFMEGGSTDNTLKLAKKYGARVIKNPRTEPVYGKYLGFVKARGKYLMYLDHDEVLLNKNSIATKVEALENTQTAMAVAGGGYRSPKGYPFINDYINEFGDPFSFFVYRLSKRDKFFINTMKNRYPVIEKKKDYLVFDLSQASETPIIELVAGGSMFNGTVLKKEHPETKKDFKLLTHFFYLLFDKYKSVIVLKNDPILHYSSDILSKYINKIRWRVKNNILFADSMGQTGYLGRESYHSGMQNYKKYLFLPYVFTLIPLLLDATYLVITRREIKYYTHVLLSLITGVFIVYYYASKVLGKKYLLKNYDESKVVSIKS